MEIVNNIPSADRDLLLYLTLVISDDLPSNTLDTLIIDGLTKDSSLQLRNFRFTFDNNVFLVLNKSDIPTLLQFIYKTSPESFLRNLTPSQLNSIIDVDKVVTLIEAHAFDVFDDTDESSKILFEVNTAIDFFKHHGFSTYASQMLNYPSEEIVNVVIEHNLIQPSFLTILCNNIGRDFFKGSNDREIKDRPEYLYVPDTLLYNI